MDYNIKNITDLDPITSIETTDVFLIGRNSNSYYSTFKTAFETISARIYRDVRNSLSSTYQDISCLNDTLQQEYHNHLIDAYVAKQMLNKIDDLNTMMNRIYPVGSIYITTKTGNPKDLLNWSSSTWIQISKGRCLMGANEDSELSTTVDSGLPLLSGNVNVTGLSTDTSGIHSHTYNICSTDGKDAGHPRSGHKTSGYDHQGTTHTSGQHSHKITGKNAKISFTSGDGIYGKSTIVQPPAFFVNIWTRTE